MTRPRTVLVAAGADRQPAAQRLLGPGKPGGSVAGDFPSAATSRSWCPAAPGGGWDLTARQFQHVIQEDKLLPDRSVSVVNVTGAGGAVGISKLVTKNRKDPHTLMITGLVMVGALTLNQSKITISDTTPIATHHRRAGGARGQGRLTAEVPQGPGRDVQGRPGVRSAGAAARSAAPTTSPRAPW